MSKIKSFLQKLLLILKYFHQPKEIFFLFFLTCLCLISFILILHNLGNYFKVDRIIYAGQVNEGVVGIPKITNPFQPSNQAEKNLSTLLFSSLIKNLQLDNNYSLALAIKIETTSDKKEYKIYLNPNAKFSNGKNISAEDIAYSLKNIPVERNFTTEIIDSKTILVKFKQNNTQENLETFTYPIIQKDENFDTSYSLNLVTSGSFKIKNVEKDKDGNINTVTLERFDNGENKLPYLKKYTFYFYNNESESLTDFQTKKLNLLSGMEGKIISKIKDDQSLRIATSTLSNNFSLFLNQNENEVLRDTEFRQILSESIDRSALVNQVFGGYAMPQKNILGEISKNASFDNLIKRIVAGKDNGLFFENGVLYKSIKTDNGKKKEPVKISITTINNKELVDTADFVAKSWKKLGVEATIKTIERSELQTIVKDRDFDILLFGFSIKNLSDYSSFFHGKERAYPKLNIANYTRKKVDDILDNLHDEKNVDRQKNLVQELSRELENDMPVVLLYKPFLIQAISGNVTTFVPNSLYQETDKYKNIEDWYIYTEKVLKIFETISPLKSISIFLDKFFN